jgi:DNA polymerase III subunit delta
MVTTLTGPNDLMRRGALDKLVAAFITEHTDIALERLDGEETDAAVMRGALASLPFLTSRKLVVLYEPGKQKAFAEHIADILKDIADTTDVIIYEPKLDKRLTYYKTLKKETDFKEFAELDGSGLARWAAVYVKALNGALSTEDARYLIDRVGPNQMSLLHELDKLVTYDPKISRKTIALLTEPLPQSTIFELLDAAFAGKAELAFALYREQRALKVEPQAIIGLLAWQLHVLAVVAAGAGGSTDDIAKAAKLNPFVVRKSQTLARRLSLARLRQLVAELLALDLQLKRTALDADEAVQLYLLKLASA